MACLVRERAPLENIKVVTILCAHVTTSVMSGTVLATTNTTSGPLLLTPTPAVCLLPTT